MIRLLPVAEDAVGPHLKAAACFHPDAEQLAVGRGGLDQAHLRVKVDRLPLVHRLGRVLLQHRPEVAAEAVAVIPRGVGTVQPLLAEGVVVPVQTELEDLLLLGDGTVAHRFFGKFPGIDLHQPVQHRVPGRRGHYAAQLLLQLFPAAGHGNGNGGVRLVPVHGKDVVEDARPRPPAAEVLPVILQHRPRGVAEGQVLPRLLVFV